MNIRAKLILLVVGMVVLILGATSVYFIVQAPVERIEVERKVLDTLADGTKILQVELNRLDSSIFVSARPRFFAARKSFSDAFGNIGSVVYLRKSDAALAEALDIVERLQKLNEENLNQVVDLYEELYKNAEALFVFPDNITFRRFYGEDPVSNRSPETKAIALFNLSRFDSAVNILNDSLESSSNVIAEQGAVIDNRIEEIRASAVRIAAMAVAFLVVVIAFAAILFANAIAKNVIHISAGVKGLSEGDLTVSFSMKSRDEIGMLAKRMNDFISSLDESILGIKAAAGRNAIVRDQLLDATQRTGYSLADMRAAVREVEAQAKLLDEKIGETRSSVSSISGGVGQLDARISDQIAMVEESTAAITQMLATIGNMARLAERDRDLADSLVRTSDAGREVFLAAFDKIEAITERVGKIEEMIEIIDTIAGQTNLLAMNAAIEAAHAGDAGKGFAVVADEIRKLAEASAEGSREIAGSVRSIIESIESAKEGSAETTRSFGEIEDKIKDVSRSVAEISASLAESDDGGRQILTAMTSLRELSASINTESSSVAENGRSIELSMGDLDRVADSVRQAMSSIGRRSDDIAGTAEKTAQLAQELSSVGDDLEKRIAHFRTSCEDSGGTIVRDGACEPAETGAEGKASPSTFFKSNSLIAEATLLEE